MIFFELVAAIVLVAFIFHPIRFVMRIAIMVSGVLLLGDLIRLLA